MTQEQWLRACYDADLAASEYDAEFPPAWLIDATRRIGARKVQVWLCDESVSFSDYDCGLAVAEIAGVA